MGFCRKFESIIGGKPVLICILRCSNDNMLDGHDNGDKNDVGEVNINSYSFLIARLEQFYVTKLMIVLT